MLENCLNKKIKFREDLAEDPDRNLIKEFTEQPLEGYLAEEDVIERFQNSTLLVDENFFKSVEKGELSKDQKKRRGQSGYLRMNYLLDEEQVNLHLTLMLKAIAIGGQQFMLENLAYSNGLYASGLFRLMVPRSQAQLTNSEDIEEKE